MALKYEEQYVSGQIVDTGPKYMPVQYAYGIRKSSPFFQMFHYHIKKLKETGIFHKHATSYEAISQKFPNHSGIPISSKQSFTAFFVILMGIGGSFILLW